MKTSWLVTSAVNSRFGVFDPVERLNQTLNTVRSVRSKVPDAVIYVIDMCGTGLTKDQSDAITKEANFLADFSGDQDVINTYKINNHDIVKNLTEMMVCHKLFNAANRGEVLPLSTSDRIFKISGRYTLTDNFLIGDYERLASGMITFGKSRDSQFELTMTGVPRQYMSRLWSFDSSLLPVIEDVYKVMVENMVYTINNGRYIDIEHSLYEFMPSDRVVEFDRVGVSGNIAPNGMAVED